ncbi:MAG: hypothetical protein QME96_17415, partial [Myxococcota bacterium]|nr:hypothetical protein [Myxococcota bacterium]
RNYWHGAEHAFSHSPARLVLRDVVVRDTLANVDDGGDGQGLLIANGLHALLERVLIERSRTAGLWVFGSEAAVTGTDLAVRDTQGRQSDGIMGWGVWVQDGALARLARVAVDRNRAIGVVLRGRGTAAAMADLAVRSTQVQESDGEWGEGIWIEDGAVADVDRVLLEGNREVGAMVTGAGAVLRASDLAVRDTQPCTSPASWEYGYGLHAMDSGRVEVTRAIIERNTTAGVHAGSGLGPGGTPAGSIRLSDVIVRDTLAGADGLTGFGLAGGLGAHVAVDRSMFVRNVGVAILVAEEAAVLDARDIVVADTLSDARGMAGRGLGVQDGARASLLRAVLERNREIGVFVSGEGAVASMTDVAIRDIAERVCAADSCTGFGGGMGGGAYGGGHLEMSRFLVTGSALCGVQVAHGADESGARLSVGGTIDLHHGEVSFNTVCGANVQTDGFDVARLMDNVLFRGNGQNLDMSDLPVPDPAAPLEGP